MICKLLPKDIIYPIYTLSDCISLSQNTIAFGLGSLDFIEG